MDSAPYSSFTEDSPIQIPDGNDVFIRAPADRVLNFLVKDLDYNTSSLKAITLAYDPPQTIEAACEIVRKVMTHEMKYIGVPELFRGMRTDGTMYRVDVLWT